MFFVINRFLPIDRYKIVINFNDLHPFIDCKNGIDSYLHQVLHPCKINYKHPVRCCCHPGYCFIAWLQFFFCESSIQAKVIFWAVKSVSFLAVMLNYPPFSSLKITRCSPFKSAFDPLICLTCA